MWFGKITIDGEQHGPYRHMVPVSYNKAGKVLQAAPAALRIYGSRGAYGVRYSGQMTLTFDAE